MSEKMTYKDAGVDITEGDKFVDLITQSVRSTYRDGVLGDIGGFGGMFQLPLKYKNPVLVSGTDGVGTKLKLAFMLDKHDTIGIDAVAMCVNDIVVSGAEPLFFLDYLATGKINAEKQADIVKGIAAGCKQARCALVGGETAEMPGFYPAGEYDIAGFAVGVVERDEIINGADITEGDVVIGLASSGVHSNGYSLVRKLFFEKHRWDADKYVEEFGKTLGEELLTPTKIYVKTVLNIKSKYKIKGIAHITGGGLVENVPRVIPENVDVNIKNGSFPILPVFKVMQKLGNIDDSEMFRTFNMGIGMVMIFSKEEAKNVLRELEDLGETPYIIGEVVKGNKSCKII